MTLCEKNEGPITRIHWFVSRCNWRRETTTKLWRPISLPLIPSCSDPLERYYICGRTDLPNNCMSGRTDRPAIVVLHWCRNTSPRVTPSTERKCLQRFLLAPDTPMYPKRILPWLLCWEIDWGGNRSSRYACIHHTTCLKRPLKQAAFDETNYTKPRDT